MKLDIVIPTYQPDRKFLELIDLLNQQTIDVNKIIIINTEECYFESLIRGTSFLNINKKLDIHHISRREFDHGKTRNLGAAKSDADILVYMTQDAVPASDTMLEELIKPLTRERVAVSYARQLPAGDAGNTEQITRQFNYPDQSCYKGKEDIGQLGIKTYFCSNVCAAYKRSVFDELGGFIHHTIFNEDMIYAAKAVQAGFQIAYAADAKVIHSHNYTCMQQFKRNFDLGVSQADHPEIFENILSETEGKKMVLSTIGILAKEKHFGEILSYIVMCGYKYAGYRAGKKYKKLSSKKVMKYTMSPNYWKQKV